MNNTNEQPMFPLKLDLRPVDSGEFQEWGYGYSRLVIKQELWRPASRYIVRDKSHPKRYRVIPLQPGAYYISDHGRLFSTIKQGIIHKCRAHRRRHTRLYDAEGNSIHVRPYKLALGNWIEPPKHIRSLVYSLMDSVNHKDGNQWRDRLDNIQYCPLTTNIEHQAKVLHRSGRKKKVEKTNHQKKKREPKNPST